MSDQIQQLLNYVECEIKNRSDNVDAYFGEIKKQLESGNYVEVVKITVTAAEESSYLSALEMCLHRLRKLSHNALIHTLFALLHQPVFRGVGQLFCVLGNVQSRGLTYVRTHASTGALLTYAATNKAHGRNCRQ